MGKILGKAANVVTNVATGGTVGFKDGNLSTGVLTKAVTGKNSLKDVLFGEKDPGTPDSVIDLRSEAAKQGQENALAGYNKLLAQDTDQIAEQQTQAQENQIVQNAKDQQMQAQQLAKQRGVATSSMGIQNLLNNNARTQEQISGVRANKNTLSRSLGLENLNNAANGINQTVSAQSQGKIFKQGQASTGRSGGLASLAGMAAGAYFGGPQGAQAGYSIGKSLGNF